MQDLVLLVRQEEGRDADGFLGGANLRGEI